MRKQRRGYPTITWKTEEVEGGWVAKSSTGVTIFADDYRKLVAWFSGKEFSQDTSEE